MEKIRPLQSLANRPHALILTIIALLIAIFLVSTRWLTNDNILANKRAHQQALLTQLLPKGFDNNPFSRAIEIVDPVRGTLLAYPATKNNNTHAVIIDTYSSDGYNGRIEMLIGINADLSISGVRITRHLETPGLGDDIDHRKSDWITVFNGKSLEQPAQQFWSIKKDGGSFDQFTGATITPRAVVKTVRDTLTIATEQVDVLFNGNHYK